MKKNLVHRKALSLFLSIALMLSIFGVDTVGVHADSEDFTHLHDSQIVLDLDSGSIMFTAYGYNAYTFGDGIDHCFDSNATIIIRQSRTNSTPHTIIDEGTQYPINLTLDGVNIDVSNVTDPLSSTNDVTNTAKHCALCLSDFYPYINNDGYPAVNLTLKDSNYLKSGSCFAGLQVDGGQTLNIDGNGSLTATGGLGAAGIGGGANIDQANNSFQKYNHGCGTIKINGGTVTANGGPEGTFNGLGGDIFGGAGIGGGAGFPGVTEGTIFISGGTVTANGNGGGAGIGGGALSAGGGSGGTVSINGGMVTAIGSAALVNDGVSHTLLRSAGIGGAGGIDTGGSGGTITISGGTVTAKSGGAAMEHLSNAPKNDNFGNCGLQYGGSFSQGGQTYHIYYKYIDRFGYAYHATWENGSMDHILQVPTDGAAIGSGGIPYNKMQNSEDFPPHTDSGNGGTITIFGGTVTAESTKTTDNVLGGADIGNSEASYYYKTGCSHYTLMGSCRFTGGSIDTHLTGNFAASPAPTDGNGSPVYKTTATLPDIHTPTAVTVTPKGSSIGSPAQTDNQGNLHLWLPATANSNTVLNHIAIDGTSLSYESKGAVTTDGASQLTVLRTDPGLDNLTFDGQKASPTSTPGTYQVNVGSSTTEIAIDKNPASDLQYTVNNGTPHSGTDSVTVPISALETDLSIHIVAPDNTAKDYTVRVMRAERSDTALSALSMSPGTLSPSFNPGITDYTANVSSGISKVTITPITKDPDATFTVNGNSPAAGHNGVDVALNGTGRQNIIVEVTAEDGSKQVYQIAVTQTSSGHSGGTSAPSLPSFVSDNPTGAKADLSSAAFPANVTAVSLAVTPSWPSSSTDPQTAAASQVMFASITPDTIGSPFLYNIKLLDQNGSPITFTGSVTVKLPLPSGLRGTPHVFRYEPDSKTFTDMNAQVENGFLVFSTTHFSDYVVAGMGNAIVLDTLNYQMPVSGKYQIGVKLTGSKAASMKFHSTNNKIATVVKMKNGNYQVNGKKAGTVYIMFDVYDGKNKFLTHASVRVDVKTGIRPKGDSTRQIGMF